MTILHSYLKLMRINNCIMTIFGVFIGALIVVGTNILSVGYVLSITMLISFLFAGAGNALNDYFDRNIDKINHPERPLPRGEIAPRNALRFAGILFTSSIILSIFTNLVIILLTLLGLFFMLGYELYTKSRGLPGNIFIAYLTATVFLLGGAAVNNISITIPFAAMAFFATLYREIVKDIQDIGGDVSRNTLPMQIGIENSAHIARISIVGAIILSFFPYIFGLFSNTGKIIYIILVNIANITFVYSTVYALNNPAKSQYLAKVSMNIAFLSYIGGALFKSVIFI